jgi:predicted nucleic acid-binding protein
MIGLDTTILVAASLLEHEQHHRCWATLKKHIEKKQKILLTPQVLSEFIHVVTDERRFQKPLTIVEAIAKSEEWWGAEEITQVYPSEEATRLFHAWLIEYKLGRKRLLDTMLAATYSAAGAKALFTLNPKDFEIFDVFDEIIVPS